MDRVRQTFTNRLSDPVIVWVEPDCWCWELRPGEGMTVVFTREGGAGIEPLPIDLEHDGEGPNQRLTLFVNNQGLEEPDILLDGELVASGGKLTSFGEDRIVGDGKLEA